MSSVKFSQISDATLSSKRFWHVFFCEFCEISTNTFFMEHVRATTSSYFNYFVVDFKQMTIRDSCMSVITGLLNLYYSEHFCSDRHSVNICL